MTLQSKKGGILMKFTNYKQLKARLIAQGLQDAKVVKVFGGKNKTLKIVKV
jgi:hypothetical protein